MAAQTEGILELYNTLVVTCMGHQGLGSSCFQQEKKADTSERKVMDTGSSVVPGGRKKKIKSCEVGISG